MNRHLDIHVCFDLSPAFIQAVGRLTHHHHGELPMTKDEFLKVLDDAKNEIKDLMTKEHQDVLDAVAAGQVSDNVPDDVVDKVKAFVDDIKSGVSAIYDSAPTPTPTPTTPTTPTTPDQPANPATPDQPVNPATPDQPANPATPDQPANPANPAAPANPTPVPPGPVVPANPADGGTPVPSSVAP